MNIPDYKALYGKLYRAVEKSIFLLREAQEECETLCMEELDPEIDMDQFAPLSKEVSENQE